MDYIKTFVQAMTEQEGCSFEGSIDIISPKRNWAHLEKCLDENCFHFETYGIFKKILIPGFSMDKAKGGYEAEIHPVEYRAFAKTPDDLIGLASLIYYLEDKYKADSVEAKLNVYDPEGLQTSVQLGILSSEREIDLRFVTGTRTWVFMPEKGGEKGWMNVTDSLIDVTPKEPAEIPDIDPVLSPLMFANVASGLPF